ncbi:MAG TPA: L,D-transpeptidase family protein [Flavisolibacter sp.]
MGTLIRINGMAVVISLILSINSFAGANDAVCGGIIADKPGNPQYEKLQDALQRLYDIQRKGGWPKIIASQKYYLKGQSSPAISQIKQRLRINGDFKSDESSPLFTDELVAGVQRAQKRFGFRQNGVVDALLIRQLNVPVEDRIQQLQLNIERFKNTSVNNGETRLVVNIPEYKLHVYEGTKEVFNMDIVVGSEEHKTVTFDDQMTNIVFSPYWNVPTSIVENEILPAMNADKNYLRNHGYEITGYEDGLPVIRQKPGPNNSLGQVKFVFPNENGIYFHDTPAKGLFQYPKRTFSHGCIRLSDPAKLAHYLLKNSPGWTEERIKTAMKSGREQSVKLPHPVSVSISYYTAWVDDQGELQLRQDIYGIDKQAMNGVASR